MVKVKFEAREVDAWREPAPDGDGTAWTYNASYYIGTFKSAAKDPRRAFTRYLKARGIVFKRNRTRIYDDGDIIEITDRKTGEPLYCAITRY